MEPQARQNLEAAAEIEQSTGWTKARYIACSVEVKANGGDRRSDQIVADNLKLTLTDSANILRMGTRTVKKYLAVWEQAASDGHCQPSGWLTPTDGNTAVTPAEDLWPKYWEDDDSDDDSDSPKNETTAFEKALKGLKAFRKNATSGLSFNQLNELITEAERALQAIGGRK